MSARTCAGTNLQQSRRLSSVRVCLRNQPGASCTSRLSSPTTTRCKPRGRNGPANSTFDFNFTWQKQLGTAALQVNPFNVRANYGVLNVDRPYLFNSNYIYFFGDVDPRRQSCAPAGCERLDDFRYFFMAGGWQSRAGEAGNFVQHINTSYDPATLPANAKCEWELAPVVGSQ